MGTHEPVAKKLHQDKAVRAVITELLDAGWTIEEKGHRYRMWCPHHVMWIRVDNSPQNPDNHASRMRTEAARCPDRHDLGRRPHKGGNR